MPDALCSFSRLPLRKLDHEIQDVTHIDQADLTQGSKFAIQEKVFDPVRPILYFFLPWRTFCRFCCGVRAVVGF